MSTDASGPVREPVRDIWTLPNIVRVSVEERTFDPPRLHVRRGKESRVHHAWSVTIQTDGEFPVRSATPVLFVGDVQLTETERVRKNRYRFLALDGERLRNGDPIGLGWSGIDKPLLPTEFVYRAAGSADNDDD
jgi:hypothetical protein